MRSYKLSLLILVLVFAQTLKSSWAQAAFTTVLKGEMESLTNGGMATLEQMQKLDRYQMVFVGGFMNEFSADYFAENKKAIRDDLKMSRMSVYLPPSQKSISENALSLTQEFHKIYTEGGNRPLIILAHSKGGAEALTAFLNSSELQTTEIAYLVLAQSAISGTPFADQVLLICHSLFGVNLGYPGCNAGLESLSPAVTKVTIANALKTAGPSGQALMMQKVRTLRTQQSLNMVSPYFVFSARALKKYGPNDGVVLFEGQKVPGFDLDLANLELDHHGIVGNGTFERSFGFKRAVTRAVLLDFISAH